MLESNQMRFISYEVIYTTEIDRGQCMSVKVYSLLLFYSNLVARYRTTKVSGMHNIVQVK